jgi:prepilin-type N-terminal cleavage/methylation domain-containing protein
MEPTPVRPVASGRASRARRAGVTLVELLVVLMVVGVATTVVVPVLRPAGPAIDASIDPVTVQRGEALQLTMQSTGAWQVVRSSDPDEVVAQGIGADSSAAVLAMLPSGSCVPVTIAVTRGSWDPVQCRWASAEASP